MTSMRVSRIVLGVLGVVVIASLAAAQDVTYNAMPGINFAAFKTYKWVDIPGEVKPDQIVDAQIRQAIDAELAAKGLTKSANENADLYVGYQTGVNQERQWNAYGGGGGWRFGGGMASATSTTIAIGTLGLDIYDQKGQQLVWRGSATKTIDPGAKPDKREKNIANAVKKLLKNFPPATNK